MKNRAKGFTVVELMVTVAVLGVLAAVAFPSMTTYLDKQRLVSQMRAIANLAQLARSEAIKHSASGAANLKTVSMTVSSGSGWFVGLADGNAACSGVTCVINESGSSVSHVVSATECTGCAMTVSPGASPVVITYDLRGLVTAGADQTITLTSPLGKQLNLTVGKLGRITLCSPAGATSVTGIIAC